MSDVARHALIVATDTYLNDGLDHLRSPGQDAVVLAGVLENPEIGGFDVEVVRNEPAHVIRRRVEDFFADRTKGHSLLLHFSCHGLKNASGELFFAATDTLPGRLASTAVPADFVRRCMNEGRSRNTVLFLDCCYGGAFMEGMRTRAGADAHVFDSFSARGFDSGRGWAVITASNAMEYAFEGTELAADHQARPSVFTRALADGLASGEADLDADGLVSINEIYDFVYDEVRRENPHQTPSRSIHLQGDLYIACSKRRRTGGEGLPEALREAVSSPVAFSRLGAVPELRRCLESPDLALAEAACRALRALVRNDGKSVAGEAARALEEVSVRPRPGRSTSVGSASSSPNRIGGSNCWVPRWPTTASRTLVTTGSVRRRSRTPWTCRSTRLGRADGRARSRSKGRPERPPCPFAWRWSPCPFPRQRPRHRRRPGRPRRRVRLRRIVCRADRSAVSPGRWPGPPPCLLLDSHSGSDPCRGRFRLPLPRALLPRHPHVTRRPA
ncbi:caspase family protein [Nocardiopsis sp. NRRL B-16309]|uniref:caspase, EACC1-associated type n=1 Tax=Nocardiopsis sp. NRRL B-16309 TaxID=1519494 RepID=UPI0006B06501|nr:caspase family protein [Nocardiopsis sp. NRRL B-16309]